MEIVEDFGLVFRSDDYLLNMNRDKLREKHLYNNATRTKPVAKP